MLIRRKLPYYQTACSEPKWSSNPPQRSSNGQAIGLMNERTRTRSACLAQSPFIWSDMPRPPN
jgi:hypothetical protein